MKRVSDSGSDSDGEREKRREREREERKKKKSPLDLMMERKKEREGGMKDSGREREKKEDRKPKYYRDIKPIKILGVTTEPGNLGSQLVSYNPATLPRILGVFAGDYNRDFLLAFGLVMGAPLIDRTGTLAVAKYDFAPDPLDPDRRLKALHDHDCHHDLHQCRRHDLDHLSNCCHHSSDWCLLKRG